MTSRVKKQYPNIKTIYVDIKKLEESGFDVSNVHQWYDVKTPRYTVIRNAKIKEGIIVPKRKNKTLEKQRDQPEIITNQIDFSNSEESNENWDNFFNDFENVEDTDDDVII